MDVWPVRDRFLAITTWEEAINFFIEFGPFQRAIEDKAKQSTRETTEVDFGTVKSYQRLFQEFIRDEEWNSDKAVKFDGAPLSTEQTADLSRIFRTASMGEYSSPLFTLHPKGYIHVKNQRAPSPFLDFEAADVFDAVYAAIYIDKMRGMRGGVCQREGCTNTFLTTDPRKQFCDAGKGACSARVRMQRNRQAQRDSIRGGSDGKA